MMRKSMQTGRREALERIRAKIEEALNDPRPSLTDADVGHSIEALHRETMSKAQKRSTDSSRSDA